MPCGTLGGITHTVASYTSPDVGGTGHHACQGITRLLLWVSILCLVASCVAHGIRHVGWHHACGVIHVGCVTHQAPRAAVSDLPGSVLHGLWVFLSNLHCVTSVGHVSFVRASPLGAALCSSSSSSCPFSVLCPQPTFSPADVATPAPCSPQPAGTVCAVPVGLGGCVLSPGEGLWLLPSSPLVPGCVCRHGLAAAVCGMKKPLLGCQPV